MNIFFTRKYKYTIYDSLENVKSEIKSITNAKWYEYSNNIRGKFDGENSFILTHKLLVGFYSRTISNPAYIKGILFQEGENTIIRITLSPAFGLVFIFYLMVFLFLLSLFGIDILNANHDKGLLLLFPFFSLIVFLLMIMYTNGLRNRFEKSMRLRRIE